MNPPMHPPDRDDAPALPPGPRGLRLKHTWQFARDPRASFDAHFREYGEAITIPLLGMGTFVVLSDPAAIGDLFTGDPTNVVTGESNARMFEAFLGAHSLLNLDGPRHQRKRRLLMPPFHGQRMHLYARAMQEITRELMRTWQPGRSFKIQDAMAHITLEVIMRIVFGVDDPTLRARMRAAILEYLAGSYSPTAAVMAVPAAQIDLGRLSPWGRILRTRDAVYRELLAAIDLRRRAGTDGRTDILSLLLDARDESGAPMSDEELRDDLFTLLLVGHETTATTLTWGFWAILERPDVARRIRDERRAVFADGDIDPARISELVYLDAVVKEITRLHPVTDGAARLLKRPTRLGRWYIPANVMVAGSTWLTHRNPKYWQDPDRFDPERFLRARPTPFSFLPFGGGPRTCIGAAFATMEMKVVLLEILGAADLELVHTGPPRVVRRAITLAADGGVPVTLTRPVRASTPRPAGAD